MTSDNVCCLRAEVDAFLQKAPVEPPNTTLDEHIAFLVEYQRCLHEAGLAVPTWPERFGGRGLAPAEGAVIAARLGELGAPEVANYIAIEVLSPALLHYVDDERLARWLPPMASAGELWCQLFSEPEAGSDLAALRTRAAPSGDGWRLSGQKVWSTWGQYARRGLILARTGTTEERHRGLSAFVVDLAQPGVRARPLLAMTQDAEFAEVFFDDVPVSRDDLVGEVGQGWAVAMHVLGAERGPYAIHRAGVIRGVLREVLDQVRKLGADRVDPHPIARAVTAMRLLDLQIDAVTERLAAGLIPGPEAAQTKRMLAEAEQRVMAAAHDLLGADGIAWSGTPSPWIRAFLHSRAASIYGGSAQIQRNLIGERLLGLPR